MCKSVRILWMRLHNSFGLIITGEPTFAAQPNFKIGLFQSRPYLCDCLIWSY
jgi:hypothetical protein